MEDLKGKRVRLHHPFRGYRYGVIIEVLQYAYEVEFSSGMTENFFRDEFDLEC